MTLVKGLSAKVKEAVEKIDEAAADGLGGVSDSLAFKADKHDGHFHTNEQWLGLAKVPSLETVSHISVATKSS